MLTFVAVIIFGVTVFRTLFYAPTDEIRLPNEAILDQKNDLASIPTLLSIPKIKVEAKVQEVGITKKGNMSTPNNYSDVGWYKYGTLPGQMGSAVLAGHVDDGLSLPGVFYNLKNLEKGDDVFVTTKDGKDLHFVVSKINTYNFDDVNVGVFTESDGKLLKLITCTGTWVSQNKTHSERLVVTAELAEI